MSKKFSTFFESLGADELDALLSGQRFDAPDAESRHRILNAALKASNQPPTAKRRFIRRRRSLMIGFAACLLLVALVGAAYAAEQREYHSAVQFFSENALLTDGLSRGEIKAVYRDISTHAFTYEKTAAVLTNSWSTDQIGGFELFPSEPTPQEVAQIWNSRNAAVTGNDYRYVFDEIYRFDEKRGFDVLDHSVVRQFDGDVLQWEVLLPAFWVSNVYPVSDGVVVSGQSEVFSSDQTSYAWLAKIDAQGTLLWTHRMEHSLQWEQICDVLEEPDGSYTVFSADNRTAFCFTRCAADGAETFHRLTQMRAPFGVKKAARLFDGYLVQLDTAVGAETGARVLKVDAEGAVTESFAYSSEDAYYYVSDLMEYGGKLYLSAYAVPRLEDEEQNAGGRYEIAGILNAIDEWEKTQAVTELTRNNYTALLLVCDRDAGTPQVFYSVKGALGGALTQTEDGTLQWKVGRIREVKYYPVYSAFSLKGSCDVLAYTFDAAGALLGQTQTGEETDYCR